MPDVCASGIQEIGGYVTSGYRSKGSEGKIPAVEDFLREPLHIIG
jgi:hypothetical protein